MSLTLTSSDDHLPNSFTSWASTTGNSSKTSVMSATQIKQKQAFQFLAIQNTSSRAITRVPVFRDIAANQLQHWPCNAEYMFEPPMGCLLCRDLVEVFHSQLLSAINWSQILSEIFANKFIFSNNIYFGNPMESQFEDWRFVDSLRNLLITIVI